MPQFAYKAIQLDGVPTEGLIEAANRLEAMRQVELRGLKPIRLSESASAAGKAPAAASAAKDGGLTPAQLVWVLSQIEVRPDARPPGGVSAGELREYVVDLQRRLTPLAFPAGVGS